MAQPINKDITAILTEDGWSTFENENVIILENKFDILIENTENDLNEIDEVDSNNLNITFEDNFDIFVNQVIDKDEDEIIFVDSYFIGLSYFFLDYSFEACTILLYCYSDLFFTFQLNFSEKEFFFNLSTKTLQVNENLAFIENKVFNILYF